MDSCCHPYRGSAASGETRSPSSRWGLIAAAPTGARTLDHGTQQKSFFCPTIPARRDSLYPPRLTHEFW